VGRFENVAGSWLAVDLNFLAEYPANFMYYGFLRTGPPLIFNFILHWYFAVNAAPCGSFF